MQVLVAAPSQNTRSQEAAFFLPEKYGFSMHFSTQEITDVGTRLENWHCMAFREDFINSLQEHGRLPLISYREQLKEISKLEEELRKMKK